MEQSEQKQSKTVQEEEDSSTSKNDNSPNPLKDTKIIEDNDLNEGHKLSKDNDLSEDENQNKDHELNKDDDLNEDKKLIEDKNTLQDNETVQEDIKEQVMKQMQEVGTVQDNNLVQDVISVQNDKPVQEETTTQDVRLIQEATTSQADKVKSDKKILQGIKFKIMKAKRSIQKNTTMKDNNQLTNNEQISNSQQMEEENRIQKANFIKRFIREKKQKIETEEMKQLDINQIRGIISRFLFFTVSLIYLELVFHYIIYGVIDKKVLFPILFSFPIGGFCTFLTGVFIRKWNKLISLFLVMVISLCYIVHEIYYYIFKAFLSVYSIGAVGTDVMEFWAEIVSAIKTNLIYILILLVPFFVYLGIQRFLTFDKVRLRVHGYILGVVVVMHLICLTTLRFKRTDELYSPYHLYHKTWIQAFSVEKLGLMTTIRQDFSNLIFGSGDLKLDDLYVETMTGEGDEGSDWNNNENSVNNQTETDDIDKEIDTNGSSEAGNNTSQNTDGSNENDELNPTPPNIEEEKEPEVDRSPNILDIDFTALAEGESNQSINTLHNYFSTVTPTNKNEYTGLFEGYNLIMLTAEGFSPYAVDEKVTPTLYRLTHEGFVFENFYTPLWWASTSDGEYVACTSLIPKSGVISFYESGSNSMPFVLGNQFNQLGFTTRAYHNHTYTYYHRDVSHPNMGYLYKGVGNGLEVSKVWPESDYEMMVQTIPEYINDEQFHVYYMTVSGHMNYTFVGNMMSYWNREAVKDLPYSDEAKAYIAANVELDKALAYLIEELEKAGVADRTVIALSADHYPYGLEKGKIDEIAGHEVEENFEIYKNHFILWSPSIKEPIVVEKACSSLDIIPTLSNLFNLPYDSRLLMGQDILSDSDSLVIFSNRSFITDKVMYNSTNGEVTMLTEEELPENYIKNMNSIVNNKFKISESILDNDYYGHLGLEQLE